MRPRRISLVLAVAWAAGVLPARVPAEVTLDGSVGTGSPGQAVAAGNGFTYDITEDLGSVRAANLFHSFERFNVGTGESANFSGNAAIRSIIARVTGGVLSDIDGALSSTIGGADLWLVNPAGVVMGPNASIDLSGSLYLSTADFLRFADDVDLVTTLAGPTTLTTADPRAFGFVTAAPAAIRIDGASLSVPAGERAALVAGDIAVGGAAITGGGITLAAGPFDAGVYDPATPGVARGSIAVVGGRIATLGGQGAVIDGGAITLSGLSLVDESFAGESGDVIVRGDGVVVDGGTSVRRLTTGGTASGDIVFNGRSGVVVNASVLRSDSSTAAATGEIRIEGPVVGVVQSVLNSDSFDGDTGAIVVAGNDVTLAGSRLASTAGGSGAPISVVGGNVRMLLGNSLESVTFFGAGAPILIVGDSVTTDGSGNFVATSSEGLFARGGDLVISGNRVSIGADNFSTTTNFGVSGNVLLNAGVLQMTDALVTTGSLLFGTGGGILVQAGEVDLLRTGLLARSVAGTSGDVALQAGRASLVASALASEASDFGASGNVLVTTDVLELLDVSSLSARTAGAGNAGNVFVSTGELVAAGASSIGTDQVNPFGTGGSGDVFLSAGSALITSGAFVQAATNGIGDAGNVSINADRLSITAGGAVNAFTFGPGRGGTISLEVGELQIDGPSGIGADTIGGGPGGRIEVAAGTLSISGGGSITATTQGQSAGGDVTIDAGSVLMDGGEVTTRTVGLGNAGAVTIGFDALTMANDSRIAADTLGGGDGGSVTLSGGDIDMSGRSFISTLSGVVSDCTVCAGTDGAAGAITIDFGEMTLASRSVIVSETETAGSAGDIRLSGRNALFDGGEMSSRTLATGEAGDTIILLEGDFASRGGFITNASTSAGADAGSAGSITLSASNISIESSSITAATASNNVANDLATVAVLAEGQLTIDGGTVEATTSGAVAGGSVRLQGADVLMVNGASVTTDASAGGDSGRIRIDAVESVVLVGSSIRTNSSQSAGGDILVSTVGSTVGLSDSTIEASAGADGSGGDIDIATDQLLLRRSGILAEADAGNGGQVDLSVSVLLEDVESLISADSNTGTAGTINVSAPNDDVSSAVTPQNENVIPAPRVAQGRCTPEARRNASSLVLEDRGGVRRAPDDYVLSHYPLQDAADVAEGSTTKVPRGIAVALIGCNGVTP
ncbi:MAG: filamentous hemagglutinin N-terminal domain-containing protein [Pseudomonadales bacterium]